MTDRLHSRHGTLVGGPIVRRPETFLDADVPYQNWHLGSFYGSPRDFFFNEIAGFETSSRSYLLKYGVP